MDRRLLALVLVAIVAPVLCPGCMPSLSPTGLEPDAAPAAGEPGDGMIRILDPFLRERIEELEHRSPRLHAALDTIRRRGPAVRIGTPHEVAHEASWLGPTVAPDHLAEVVTRPDSATGAVTLIIVRVDLAAIRELYTTSMSPLSWFSSRRSRAEFDALVDAILIHELWGHLVPLAETPSTVCADPVAGQPDLQSCVMLRENQMRRDLGLAPRGAYALDGAGR